MLKRILYGAVAIVALIAIVAIVGSFLPKGHRASRTMIYKAPTSAVFAAITDVEQFPNWRSDIQSVEVLGNDGRGMRFRETSSQGVVTYRVVLREPDKKLVTRIDDPSLPFGGSWTLEIQPVPEGTSLTITEDGEVYNPIFRFMSKVIFSPYSTIDRYHADLQKRTENGK